MELSKKFRGKEDLEMQIENLKKQNKQSIEGYKNIIDQKELIIEEYQKKIKQLEKKLEKEKEYSKMLYESP